MRSWQCYADIPALVDHLHLPVQSGSDRVLMAMKRGHTVLEYKATMRALRRSAPISHSPLTSSSVSPVKPRQTFAATMQLIEDIGFDTSFSFIYSARPGTPAAELRDDRHGKSKNSDCTFFKLGLHSKRSRSQNRWSARSNAYSSPGPRKKIPDSCRGARKITGL